MIIIINAGREVDWRDEGARSQVRCWKRRGENASVSAHTNMMAKQCPRREGFGVQTSGSIGDVKETKRLVEQDEPVLAARHLIVPHRRRTESFKAYKGVRSCVSCL